MRAWLPYQFFELNGRYREERTACRPNPVVTVPECLQGSGHWQLRVRYGEVNEESRKWPTRSKHTISSNSFTLRRTTMAEPGGVSEVLGAGNEPAAEVSVADTPVVPMANASTAEAAKTR